MPLQDSPRYPDPERPARTKDDEAVFANAYWTTMLRTAMVLGSPGLLLGAFAAPLITLMVDDDTPSGALYVSLVVGFGIVLTALAPIALALRDARARSQVRNHPVITLLPSLLGGPMVYSAACWMVLARGVGDDVTVSEMLAAIAIAVGGVGVLVLGRRLGVRVERGEIDAQRRASGLPPL